MNEPDEVWDDLAINEYWWPFRDEHIEVGDFLKVKTHRSGHGGWKSRMEVVNTSISGGVQFETTAGTLMEITTDCRPHVLEPSCPMVYRVSPWQSYGELDRVEVYKQR